MIDFSIIVDCPDEYLDILNVFFIFLERNWKNRTQKIFITSQEKEIAHPQNVEFVKCGMDKNSIQRAKIAIESIDTEYVLIMNCDDFIGAPVDNQRISDMLRFAAVNNYSYIRVWETKNCEHRKYKTDFEHLYFCNKKARYSKSLMANFWTKKEFLNVFSSNEVDGWSVEGMWLKETYEETNGYYPHYCYYDKNPFNIVHAVSKGKWLKKAYRFAIKNEIKKELLSQRDLLPFKTQFKFDISMFLYDHLPSSVFYAFKKMFGRRKKFTTEY